MAYSLFKAAIKGVGSGTRNLQQVAKTIILDTAINALPVSEVLRVFAAYLLYVDADRFGGLNGNEGDVLPQVPAAVHSFLTRGIHSGSLIMTAVFMRELHVPIIPISELRYFLSSDEVSI